ncbi:2-hydroxycarboxylate transporter family protein [Paludifilum halophilum]|uniref:Citrate:sodium symporter n=1 Tax=Paludifilum halophilum TaxID=1642702 RepID=A0A235B528_9BACL|nr:2-hydroxycarboxylate transporter family protein [Paludifilum halophilum]OYD07342.1 citrate:sodium symporter [Paludifilum halophilum]
MAAENRQSIRSDAVGGFLYSRLKGLSLFSIPVFTFTIFTALAITAMYLDLLPKGMIGALLMMIVLGELFGWIGDHTPVIRSFLGGGAMVAIFASAYMVYSGLMPKETVTTITEFMKSGGFLNFYIAALITGSILGMNPHLLVKAGARYGLPLLAGLSGSIFMAILTGLLVGFNIKEAVLVIAMPIMGGGMGAGAVPISQIYSELMGREPTYYLSVLVPALALGNVFAIIFGGLLDQLGKRVPQLSGNGRLMKNMDVRAKKEPKFDIALMGAGLLSALIFFLLGQVLAEFIPLHPYALMILSVALAKIFKLLPETVEEGASQWYGFVAKNWTLALLVGIGVAYTDLEAVLNALSIEYVLIVFSVVLGAALGSGLIGKLVGFYPIETAITAGLCMANMGGTGDVAVLSASKRMELMPFAQISSRLGGAIILLLAGLLIPIIS